MSTKILCDEPSCVRRANSFTLDANELHAKLGELFILLNGDRSRAGHYVRRADFLAAVETECGVRMVPADAIVIERAELPPVMPGDDDTYAQVQTNGGPEGFSTSRVAAGPDHYRRVALAALAKAEYLDAHPPTPPVDEADIEALAVWFSNEGDGGIWEHFDIRGGREVARRLLATGRVSVSS